MLVQLLATYHYVFLDPNQGGQDLIVVALLSVMVLLGVYLYFLLENSFGNKAKRLIHFVFRGLFGYPPDTEITAKCHQQIKYSRAAAYSFLWYERTLLWTVVGAGSQVMHQ